MDPHQSFEMNALMTDMVHDYLHEHGKDDSVIKDTLLCKHYTWSGQINLHQEVKNDWLTSRQPIIQNAANVNTCHPLSIMRLSSTSRSRRMAHDNRRGYTRHSVDTAIEVRLSCIYTVAESR